MDASQLDQRLGRRWVAPSLRRRAIPGCPTTLTLIPSPREEAFDADATSMLLIPVALADGIPVPPPENVEGKCVCIASSRATETSRDRSSEHWRSSDVVGGVEVGTI